MHSNRNFTEVEIQLDSAIVAAGLCVLTSLVLLPASDCFVLLCCRECRFQRE